MAIKKDDRKNFETMLKAAANGDLALMECTDTKTGEYRAVICAVGRDKNGDYLMTPLGHLATENPFNLYTPPQPTEISNDAS